MSSWSPTRSAGASASGASALALSDVYVSVASGLATATSSSGVVLANSSSDQGSVLQAALDSCKGTVASTVHFNGVYTLVSGLTSYAGVNLIGTGVNATTNQNGTLIQSSFNGDLITIVQDPTGTNYFGKLSRFALAGDVSKASQRGIVLSDAGGTWQDCFLDELIVNFIGSVGVAVTAANVKAWLTKVYIEFCTSHGLSISGASRLIFSQCFFGENTGFGLVATTGYIQLEDCFFELNVGGALSLTSLIQLLVSGTRFINNGDATHPQVNVASNFSTTKGFTIADNIFVDTRGGSAVANHIAFASSHTINGEVSGNVFSGSSGPAIAIFAQPGYRVNIHDNPGYNDVFGKIASPWYTPVSLEAAVGAFTSGSTLTAAPVASTDYFATVGGVYIVSTGGTGVSITIKNGHGDIIQSGLATFAGVLPFGWLINFGAFSVAPTTIVSVV